MNCHQIFPYKVLENEGKAIIIIIIYYTCQASQLSLWLPTDFSPVTGAHNSYGRLQTASFDGVLYVQSANSHPQNVVKKKQKHQKSTGHFMTKYLILSTLVLICCICCAQHLWGLFLEKFLSRKVILMLSQTTLFHTGWLICIKWLQGNAWQVYHYARFIFYFLAHYDEPFFFVQVCQVLSKPVLWQWQLDSGQLNILIPKDNDISPHLCL